MTAQEAAPKTIDEYISGFPADVQEILEQVRLTIREAAPDASETISYRLATFVLKGNLVHFGAFKKHIGFYPTSSGIEKFRNELSAYQSSKGAVRFPLGEPIPYALIAQIVEFRIHENLERAQARARKR